MVGPSWVAHRKVIDYVLLPVLVGRARVACDLGVGQHLVRGSGVNYSEKRHPASG